MYKRQGFDGAYLFQYSPRPHTPALKLKDGVPPEEKSRRLQTLLKAQRAANLKIGHSLIGQTFEVLFDSRARKNRGQLVGRTRHYRRVVVSSEQDLIGEFRPVRILGAANETLLGELKA